MYEFFFGPPLPSIPLAASPGSALQERLERLERSTRIGERDSEFSVNPHVTVEEYIAGCSDSDGKVLQCLDDGP